MLPFLKNDKKNAGISGTIVKTREPDKTPENQEDNDSAAEIHACAQDIISAVHAKDVKALASALKDTFEILESMPHEEAEHSPEPHSYEASKE